MLSSSSSWLKLANKTVIVTGAGSGIGAAVAKAFSEEGSRLVLADVNLNHLEAVQDECLVVRGGSGGGKKKNHHQQPLQNNAVTIFECDVSKEDQVRRLFAQSSYCVSSNDDPSSSCILVNCAGITRDGWIGKMDTVEQWQPVIDVNLTGTFLCCREFLNQSLPNGGAIVNVSSVVALQGNLGQTNYAASKGGVLSLTKALAKEVAHRRVRVNAVAPGFIETPMVASVPDKVQIEVRKKVALGKFGTSVDVANLILFLASCDRSGYITGETVECSGLISL